jgi:hypothetical protein
MGVPGSPSRAAASRCITPCEVRTIKAGFNKEFVPAGGDPVEVVMGVPGSPSRAAASRCITPCEVRTIKAGFSKEPVFAAETDPEAVELVLPATVPPGTLELAGDPVVPATLVSDLAAAIARVEVMGAEGSVPVAVEPEVPVRVVPEAAGKPAFSVPVVPGILVSVVVAPGWVPVRGNAGLTVAGRSPGPFAGSVGSVGSEGVPACSCVDTRSPGPLPGTVGSVATFRSLVLGRMSAKNAWIWFTSVWSPKSGNRVLEKLGAFLSNCGSNANCAVVALFAPAVKLRPEGGIANNLPVKPAEPE